MGGVGCIFLGVLLFLDRFLLSVGNVAYLMGLCFLLGVQKTGRFFFRKEKAVGATLYFVGLGLIVYRWAFVGFCIQLYGFWKLFASFLPNVIQSLKMIPGVNMLFKLPGFSHVADKVYESRRLPV